MSEPETGIDLAIEDAVGSIKTELRKHTPDSAEGEAFIDAVDELVTQHELDELLAETFREGTNTSRVANRSQLETTRKDIKGKIKQRRIPPGAYSVAYQDWLTRYEVLLKTHVDSNKTLRATFTDSADTMRKLQTDFRAGKL